MRIIKTAKYEKSSASWGPLGREKSLSTIRYLKNNRDEEYNEDTGHFVITPHTDPENYQFESDSWDVFYITNKSDIAEGNVPPMQKIFVDTIGSIEEAKKAYPSAEISGHTEETGLDPIGEFEDTFDNQDVHYSY